MGDVGGQRTARANRAGLLRHELKVRGPGEFVRFRAEKRAPEAETGRRGGVMVVDVSELPAFRRAVDGAVVLRIEIVEHADGENDGEGEDRGLFHASQIIPRSADFVNAPREPDLGAGR